MHRFFKNRVYFEPESPKSSFGFNYELKLQGFFCGGGDNNCLKAIIRARTLSSQNLEQFIVFICKKKNKTILIFYLSLHIQSMQTVNPMLIWV